MHLHSYLLYDIADVKCPLHLNLPNEYPICFNITDQNLSALHFFYTHLLHSTIKPGFCFYIDIKENKGEHIKLLVREYIVPSFFHFQYMKDYFSAPLLLVSLPAGSDNYFLSLFNDTAIEQGFSNISFLTSKSDPISILSSNDEDLFEHYENSLLKMTDFQEPILFHISSIEEIHTLLLKLNNVENILTTKHHQLIRLLSSYNKLYKERRQMSFQNGTLAQSLESLSKYSSDVNEPGSFYKKKITDIVDFYKNEYEILPLWYKRLGHILKVITGKRTFRSLFDKNSKKYKL